MNQFENLKSVCKSYHEDYIASEIEWLKIFSDSKEVIHIGYAKYESNWVAGCTVYWEDGRVSVKPVHPESGLFRSYKDAILYMLGFLVSFDQYLRKDSIIKIKSEISKFNQKNLFDYA